MIYGVHRWNNFVLFYCIIIVLFAQKLHHLFVCVTLYKLLDFIPLWGGFFLYVICMFSQCLRVYSGCFGFLNQYNTARTELEMQNLVSCVRLCLVITCVMSHYLYCHSCVKNKYTNKPTVICLYDKSVLMNSCLLYQHRECIIYGTQPRSIMLYITAWAFLSLLLLFLLNYVRTVTSTVISLIFLANGWTVLLMSVCP